MRFRFPLGALPQTPLGELTALPQPPNWIWGPNSNRMGKERGGKGRRGLSLPKVNFLITSLIIIMQRLLLGFSQKLFFSAGCPSGPFLSPNRQYKISEYQEH